MTGHKTNLVAISYEEAKELYVANGHRPFSFFAATDGVLKTISVKRGRVMVSAPQWVYRFYARKAEAQ